jgi:preprotein translocase subunit SecA
MDRIASLMERSDIPEDMPIQAGMVSKAIEGAQRQVEAQNFAARKYVLEYDDVMNKQRQVIYTERNRVLDGKDIRGNVHEMIEQVMTSLVAQFCPEKTYAEEWDWDGLAEQVREIAGADLLTSDLRALDNPYELGDGLVAAILARYEIKESELGAEALRELERQVMLRVIDARWMSHLLEMDYLRDGIGLRAIGQRDPLVEYKSEAFETFTHLVEDIKLDFLRTVMHIQVMREVEHASPLEKQVSYSAPSEQTIFSGATQQAAAGEAAADAMGQASAATGGSAAVAAAKVATVTKSDGDPYAGVGRNEPCPCGSGKKYKHCHGRVA